MVLRVDWRASDSSQQELRLRGHASWQLGIIEGHWLASADVGAIGFPAQFQLDRFRRRGVPGGESATDQRHYGATVLDC